MIKFHFFFFILLASINAHADTEDRFLRDGTSLQTITEKLQEKFNATNLSVSDYSRALASHNPFASESGTENQYRIMSFSFADRSGDKQEFKCKATLSKSENRILVYGCTGGTKPIHHYFRYASGKKDGGSDSFILQRITTQQDNPVKAPARSR